ncbi:Rho-type GTPase [Spraguea lophii 42_110]|uniref:Rho-type GTPase n=1 Tax=Spraguea lophii (strain 42_110) TaxID=1358809 RepID=S7XR42_SPRLO|nr:Rho-type GTPase [Spraguea lophii 42_110]
MVFVLDLSKYNNIISTDMRSINDLNEEEISKLIKSEKEKHTNIYNKFTLLQKSFIEDGILSRLFYKKKYVFSITENKEHLIRTNIKVGKSDIVIPLKFVLVMESILNKDLKVKGLFRKCANVNDIKKLSELIESLTEKNYDEIYKKVCKYDIITCCVFYKTLFSKYKNPILSSNATTLFTGVITDETDVNKRAIMFRFLILGLPRENRMLLISLVMFFIIIYVESTDNGTDLDARLSIKGLAACIAPQIVMTSKIKDNNYLRQLVDVISCIFTHFETIFMI